jgi:hypothetical protein
VRRLATTVRCVPRIGYSNTEVRTIDVGISDEAESHDLRDAVNFWFTSHGIADAVYDIGWDNDGIYAVINDEAYVVNWGRPLL